jgi:hypothetical protein
MILQLQDIMKGTHIIKEIIIPHDCFYIVVFPLCFQKEPCLVGCLDEPDL